nr:hypothetical protein [Tanacetum cinerariifolium]
KNIGYGCADDLNMPNLKEIVYSDNDEDVGAEADMIIWIQISLRMRKNVTGHGSGPTWLFDIDTLKKSMNYKPVVTGNQSNGNAGTKENIDAGQAGKKTIPDQEYILLPFWTSDPLLSQGPKNTEDNAGKKVTKVPKKESGVSSKEDDKDDQDLRDKFERLIQQENNGENDVNSTNNINTVSLTINTTSIKDNNIDKNIGYGCADDLNMPNLKEIVYSDNDEDVGAKADMIIWIQISLSVLF